MTSSGENKIFTNKEQPKLTAIIVNPQTAQSHIAVLNYCIVTYEISWSVSVKVASVMHDASSLFHRPQSIMFALNKCIGFFSR